MAYFTKREKQAYRTGLLNGLKRNKNKTKNLTKHTSGKRASKHKVIPRRIGSAKYRNNPFGMTYNQLVREKEFEKIDLLGDFEYDSRGRIKGSYTPDGRFEPD